MLTTNTSKSNYNEGLPWLRYVTSKVDAIFISYSFSLSISLQMFSHSSPLFLIGLCSNANFSYNLRCPSYFFVLLTLHGLTFLLRFCYSLCLFTSVCLPPFRSGPRGIMSGRKEEMSRLSINLLICLLVRFEDKSSEHLIIKGTAIFLYLSVFAFLSVSLPYRTCCLCI
jgi:hypothetical protein